MKVGRASSTSWVARWCGATLGLATACAQGPVEYRGEYTHGFEVSAFTPCGQKQSWWVRDGITAQVIPFMDSVAPDRWGGDPAFRRPTTVYLHVRGILSDSARFGHLDGYARELRVTEVLDMRPSAPAACR